MSVKYFCDFCACEMTERPSGGTNSARLEAELQRGGHCLKVEVIHSTDGVGNAGHACKHCILDALAKADDRPPSSAFYVIERPEGWLSGIAGGHHTWTSVIGEAIKFTDRGSAETAMGLMLVGLGGHVTEHGWIGAKP